MDLGDKRTKRYERVRTLKISLQEVSLADIRTQPLLLGLSSDTPIAASVFSYTSDRGIGWDDILDQSNMNDS